MLFIPVSRPRVLSTQPRRIAYNLSELTNVMQPLDMDADDVRKMVIKLPHLLVANPVTIAVKLEALRVSNSRSRHRSCPATRTHSSYIKLLL